MALTAAEKLKIGILRSRFIDEEWGKLAADDVYARERIAFYAVKEIQMVEDSRQFIENEIDMLNKQIYLLLNKLTILMD